MEETRHAKTGDHYHPITLMGIPQSHDVLQAYEVYRSSIETRELKSEQGRTICAEALIENTLLGPLRDLCVAALAQAYAPHELLESVRSDPLKMRLYYDALSVDLPLERCYFITDEKYWRRTVLAKTTDPCLGFKTDYNWRSLGLSMKFVELVEACPAEYWPENEMMPEAMKIKDFVTEMHIRRLRSLTDEHFEQYFAFESEDSDYFESDSTTVKSYLQTPGSTVASIVVPKSLRGSEEDGDAPTEEWNAAAEVNEEPETEIIEPSKTEEELQREREYDEVCQVQRERIEKLKREQQERRAARVLRRLEIEARNKAPTPPPEPAVPGKRRRKFRPKGVFDIPVEPASSDEEKYMKDRRNKDRCLRRLKKYEYPPKDCHHVSLSFLRFFENLTEFSLEFLGPEMQRDFHYRHLRFSYRDMDNLAIGISYLNKLQVFRLRNSQMDAEKLEIIAKALTNLPNLEVVDFGFDLLRDDSGVALFNLLRYSASIKSLELEYNQLKANAIHFLGIALRTYAGKLEYLGLAGNPLGDDALHKLNEKIRGTEHITQLCLRSAKLTQNAIICCIADELLKHPPLQSLDLRTVHVSDQAAIKMLGTLRDNQNICQLDCRGCDMNEIYDLDIQVILLRNRYIKEYTYIGNHTLTLDEVDEMVSRIKNPIYLRALEAVKRRSVCLQNRPDIISLESLRITETAEPTDEPRSSILSLDQLIPKSKQPKDEEMAAEEELESMSSTMPLPNSPFIYDTNNFTEDEFLAHVYLPGPRERYRYFHPIVDSTLTYGETRNT